MTIVVTAIVVVVVIELIGWGRGGALLMALAGIPVLGALAMLVRSLLEQTRPQDDSSLDDGEMQNGPAEMLDRWHARAQMLTDRADGTRADWDRYLRPLVAKEFELSSGHRIAKNRSVTETVGRNQFGPELWRWVDPAESATRDQTTRAPGRGALEEILRRLQEM
ncbi:MAG: hypothetical protein J2P18_10280 [Nocardia sp.]|nr:hypothetical protein [Nocardia sp.]